ncbi:SCO family protein [Priestia flexa]|uniref:SCO family protein n=1 Tax=Priestia flexa TaxID=86664 RepID=A0A8I1MG55_9BACI|nr:SCO family protein [Priestia flexa]MBN8251677.1 SCO family protein [Priestia flexa]RIV13380.1 SCO family protein [Priestia flexa]UZW67980.1 SCO family protein [Priestia flexa]
MLLCLVLVIVLAACGSQIKDPLNWKLNSFIYTNQENKEVSLDNLKGKVWVSNFIFTNCETVCPPMTAHMAKLQKMVKEEGLDANFISFSVDPENDSPDKLKEFAAKFNADLSNWHFLTGYAQQEIEKFALDQFKAVVKKPENDPQVIHATTFYLIDKEGTVMKSYSGVGDTPYDEIIKDMKTLSK